MSAEMSEFIAVYNDHETYPSMADVAEALGISIKTVRNKAGMLRNLAKSDPTAPKLIMRPNVNDNPMSEDSSKFMEHWTADDCIAELRRIAEIDPEKIVTRNYFRNHSSISESTWNRYFGTFEEFKRQAGIKLSRQQHAHERAIAKHASVDHYRRINVERQDWAEKYVRENANRFKTMLVCSDLHDVEIDLFYLRVLIDFKYFRSARLLWLLPALMLAWVNLHGAFMSGIALLAAFLAAEIANAWLFPVRHAR